MDGVLAPIVPRPEDAAVPPEGRRELARLAGRYALVACLSGRAGDDAARVVGVPDVVYVGNHGLELHPEAGRWVPRLQAFAEEADWPVEDKGVTLSFHYRGAADEREARRALEGIAARAREAGLDARFGRKVLEVRPPLEADKGSALQALLRARGLARALYAGDDTTDLDAFRALDHGWEAAVRVAVASEEGPAELVARADVVVGSPEELLALLVLL